MTKTGDLKWPITIRQHGTYTDDKGHPKEGWTDYIKTFAAKRGLSGKEYYSAAAVNSETDVIFIIRYREDITSEMQLIDGTDVEHPYNIKSAVNKEGKKNWLEIRARR